MPIQCYGDEAGTHDVTGLSRGSDFAVVAGYIGLKEQWDVFTPLWLDVLESNGFNGRPFHMAEMLNEPEQCGKTDCDSIYHGWDRERRDAFIHKLIPIARDNSEFAVGACVDVRAYDRVFPDVVKEAMVHPYHLCFQRFFQKLGAVRPHYSQTLPLDEEVGFVFDRQDQFKQHALAVYDSMRKTPTVGEWFGGIKFEDKTKYVPLQAVDLLAVRLRKLVSRIATEGNAALQHMPNSWNAALGSRDNIYFEILDEPALRALLARIADGSTTQIQVTPRQSRN